MMQEITRFKKQFILGFFLGFIALVIVLVLSDFKEVGLVFSNMRLEMLPLLLVLAPINYFFRYIKWVYYLKILNIQPDPYFSRIIFMSGLAMTITPAKMGELLKCYLLKEHIGTPVSKSSSIIVAERLTDGLALVLLAAIGFWVFPFGQSTILIALTLLTLLLIALKSKTFFAFFLRKLYQFRFLEHLLRFLTEFQGNAQNLFKPRPLVVAILIGFISWMFEGLVIYLAIQSLHADISILGSLFIIAVSSLIGALSFLPGGLFVAEGSIMGLLILLGIDTDVAAATTTITRISTLWLGVLLGILGLFLTKRRLDKTTSTVAPS